MGLCADAKKEAAVRICEWDEQLHVHVSVPTGLRQNAERNEAFFRAYGKGPHQHIDFDGTPKLCLRHLGARHHFDGI
eukprot:4740013-Pyramimonas_sp.AAC.1